MMGVDLNYQFTPDFNLGAPDAYVRNAVDNQNSDGDESVKNTLWGLNASYKGEVNG